MPEEKAEVVMNTYLIGVKKYFGGEHTFEVDAENKTDALIKARSSNAFLYCRDDINGSTIHVVKKINNRRRIAESVAQQ